MAKLRTLVIVVLMTLSAFAVFAPVGVAAEDGSPGLYDFGPCTTDRIVIFEQFTAGGCGFCPPVSQGLQMMESNYGRDEAVILSYHGTMGGDPLAVPYTPTRMSMYGYGGYPSVSVDGVLHKVGGGGTGAQQYTALQNLYNQRTNVGSELKITIEGDLDQSMETGDLWVNISAIDTVTEDNLRLHVVVFENDVDYNAPNGETVHDFVVREMLDGVNGKSISISNGQDLSYFYSFNFPSNQDPAEVGVIAFVQTTDRTADGNYWDNPILQAAYVNVIPMPNVAPQISQGIVEMTDGATEDDEVTFKVFYKDTDDWRDNGPTQAKVFIKGDNAGVLERDLTKVPSGVPWTEGKWMQHKTKLAPDTYSFRFNCTDGEDFATGDDGWNPTTFTILPRNKLPELSTQSFAPLEGDTNTEFRFDVMYRDMDNDEPVDANIYINDVAYTMSTDETAVFNDWVTYYYTTTLSVGDTHRYYFTFSDGKDTVRMPAIDASPNWLRGPTVTKPNNEPTLTTALFDPDTGTRMDQFTFTIIYTDGENDHPTISYIYIDEVPHIMNPDGFNYDNGEVFRFRTALDMGDHVIRFMFNDGKNEVRFPATGTMPGPTVVNLDPEGVIAAPTDGMRYTPDDFVPFSAVGSDDPEGDPLDYMWTSSIDGVLSTQEAFDKRLSEGEHVITLEVTDEYGGLQTLTVTVDVKAKMPEPFVVGHTSSVTDPVEMDMIRYTITIDNRGEATAQGIEVKFIVDGTMINSDTLSVSVGNQVEVRFTWEAEVGPHTIRIEVPGDSYEFTENVNSNTPPTVTTEIVNPGGKESKYKEGEEIYFKASGSDDNGDSMTYLWDFGDGITSTKADASHIYAAPATYTVTLTITDSRGGTTTDTFTVEITKEKAEGDEAPGFGAVVAIAAFMAVIVAVSRRRM
ncbi:MAG: PKD domain-containing protein [Thermoplasmata archaeon]|nr:MAG: PKD domain-containing protein [Thermoplasmata archaeon]